MDKELHRIVSTCIIYKAVPPSQGFGEVKKYLLLQRSFEKKVFPGKWTVPGGGLSIDDYINLPKTTSEHWYFALENSLRREIKEEAGIEVGITEVGKNENELPVYGILYCSILKRENFELVAQKSTEIGIKEIVPIISSRTIKMNLREDRLEKIIKEAAEQSDRGILPILNKPMKFDDALIHSRANDFNIFFHPGGEPVHGIKHAFQKVGIFVGPEGGWDEAEEKAVADLSTGAGHYKIANLGPLTLRAETAAIVATYAVLNLK